MQIRGVLRARRAARNGVDAVWDLLPGGTPTRLSPLDRAWRAADERRDADLLAFAQRAAAGRGAERFAAEFRRREEDEQRRRGAATFSFGYPDVVDAESALMLSAATSGPVDSDVAESAVQPGEDQLELKEPMRHPHVPRPPAGAAEPESRRRRRRRQRDEPAVASLDMNAEAARTSPGGRLLYAFDDRPNGTGR